jgi:signal transduction histidine kinase
LTIRTKLAGTLAVPLAALAAFSALQVKDSYVRADQVKRQAALATSAAGPSGLLTALELERDYESLWQMGAQDLVDATLQTSGDATSRTDHALARFRSQVGDLGTDVAGNYQATLASVSTNLAKLRKDAQEHASKTRSPATANQANKIFDRYTALIDQLLAVSERTSRAIDDAALRNGAELLNAIARQVDVEEQLAIKAVLAAVSSDPKTVTQVQQLNGVRVAGEAALARRGEDRYSNAVTATTASKDRAAIVAKLDAIARDPLRATVDDVMATASVAANLWRVPQGAVADVMTQRLESLTATAQDEQRLWVILTIGSVLLAVAVLWLAGRWITRPLRALAEQAAAVAGKRLPRAVEEILHTAPGAEVQVPEVEPVRVRGGWEVRAVAGALNQVQESALALAVEQARLRGNVAEAFVNLGRRNQNLLSRQLEFISQLEKDESDPERLEHLFKLDHLATRMRRNAESLLVLAGHEPPRTWSAPVAVVDVVRGALGEVEGYRRVRLRHLDAARVDGTAAVDVSHVLSELVENALAFSPPDVDVEVFGRRDDDGYVLTIVDQGIGMTPDDLERANALIASGDARMFAASRFLGHYVVAQLAARHGLDVHLGASPAGGLTAAVGLPASLLDGAAAPDMPRPEVPRLDMPRLDVPPAASAPPALPRRDGAPAEPVLAIVVEPDVQPPPPVAPIAALPAPEVPAVAEAVAEAVPVVGPAAADAPAAPETRPRLRLGVGTFADLRGPKSAADPPAPAPAAPAPVPASPASEPPPVLAPPAPPAGPDRAAAFAQVAHAVEAAAAPPAAPPVPALHNAFSEDLLPQKLPKRGRRGPRAPWVREKPARPPVAPAAPAPPAPAAVAPPGPGRPGPAPDPQAAAPSGVTVGGAPEPGATAADSPPVAEGGDRFAFFAAFRAAAERAREEAGIDDRRG